MPNTNDKKSGGGGRGKLPIPKLPKTDSFWVNLVSSVLVLLLLASAYAFLTSAGSKKPAEIPLSQLAQDIGAGNVSKIIVYVYNLDDTYTDSSEKTSKK